MYTKQLRMGSNKNVPPAIALYGLQYHLQSHLMYFTSCLSALWSSSGFLYEDEMKDLALDRERATNVIALLLRSCSHDRELRPPHHASLSALRYASFCTDAHHHSRCA